MILSSHQMQLSLDLLTKRFTHWFEKLYTLFFSLSFVCLLLRTEQCHIEWCNASLLPSAFCHGCCIFLFEEMINAVALPTANYSNIIHVYFSPTSSRSANNFFVHGCPLSNYIFYGFTHVRKTTEPVASGKKTVFFSVSVARVFSHTLSFIGLDDIVAGIFHLY